MAKKIKEQLAFSIQYQSRTLAREGSYYDRLNEVLSTDLNFHQFESGYSAHKSHAFPAKFPPQLPQKFILNLTNPGDVVLDPMVGSGTTILEAYLNGRRSIGIDIDPLAVLISEIKATPVNSEEVLSTTINILKSAKDHIKINPDELVVYFESHWDAETRQFIDYWFSHDVRNELLAIIFEIDQVEDHTIRKFLLIAFSAMIITKTGGVSLALDLAHTRPHRAKIIIDQNGKELLSDAELPEIKAKYLTKILRSPLLEFEKRVKSNLKDLYHPDSSVYKPSIIYANAQAIPLRDEQVDLIVTSPPYASNAIDYMRAHKFSLVWMNFSLDKLGVKRKEYIGSETINGDNLEDLPDYVSTLVNEIGNLDRKKGMILHRYYSDMTHSLSEMFRVLKPDKAAVVVVGSNIIRNKDTQTHLCLAEIGRKIGFIVPNIGTRALDRNRRMLPVGNKIDLSSQIQQRMHFEYVIGFYKPV